MAFEYGCFISYRHLAGIETIVRRLASDIKKELDLYGFPPSKVFLDEDRIQSGDNFNMLIPSSLCKSIVMIVVYVPDYFNKHKPYCTKEFVAFLEHEKRRLIEVTQKYPQHDLAKLHQIIPIILRKDPAIALPPELGTRDYIDWSTTTIFERTKEFAKTVPYANAKREICNKIRDIWNSLPQLDVLADCQQYAQMPDEQHELFKRLVQSQTPLFPS